MADVELNEDPASTWGATQAYKDAWNEKYGVKAPAASASKGEWVDFAVEHGGVDRETAEGMKRDDLVSQYGNEAVTAGVSTAPSGGTVYGSGGTASGTPATTPGTSTSPATGSKGV